MRVSDSSCGATWMRKRCLSRWLDLYGEVPLRREAAARRRWRGPGSGAQRGDSQLEGRGALQRHDVRLADEQRLGETRLPAEKHARPLPTLPTARRRRVACRRLTAEPFSYRSVARSGSEQSTMGTSAESCTPTLSVKGRRFDTTSSSSLSPFSRVLISTLCTRCSRMRSLRPLMTTAVLLQLGATVAIAVVVAGAAAAAAGAEEPATSLSPAHGG